MTKYLAIELPKEGSTTYNIQEDFSQWTSKLPGWQLFENPDAPKTPITPANFINILLPFIFTIAGLILFFMLIFGGFTIFTSTGNEEKINQGKGMIVNALVGFIIIFAAYWIIQFLEFTLGISILGA